MLVSDTSRTTHALQHWQLSNGIIMYFTRQSMQAPWSEKFLAASPVEARKIFVFKKKKNRGFVALQPFAS